MQESLVDLCPSRLQADGGARFVEALLGRVAQVAEFAGLYLLDDEVGYYERQRTSAWPADLDALRFRLGDAVLVPLLSGPLRGEEIERHGYPKRLCYLAPLYDERSQVRGLLAAGRVQPDVGSGFDTWAAQLSCALRLTSLPREKEALRRYYGEVLDHLRDAVILTDVEGLILHWNQGAERLLGYKASDVLTRGANFLYPEQSLDEVRQQRLRTWGGEVLRDYSCTRVDRRGRARRLLATSLPVRDGENRVIGVAEILSPPARNGQISAPATNENNGSESAAGVASIAPSVPIDGMVGAHPSIVKLHAQIGKVAAADAPVLVLGESGTGKELVARALHVQSPRRAREFVAINCAAIPSDLLESEVFGYERGAFTGATHQRKGLLEQAAGGTVFLDEVAELPLHLQTKLLRAIQEKTVRRLGGLREVELDLRFIAATNRPIRRLVDESFFREDLYYRLNVLNVTLPPLRQRASDIPLLARHGLDQLAHRYDRERKNLVPEALDALMEHSWPGNVRELLSVLERAYLTCDGPVIRAEEVRQALPESTPVLRQIYDGDIKLSLEEVERRHMANVLAEVGGRVSEAARVLGVSRETVYKKLKKYSLRG